jgi:hypothetical protein
MGPAISPASRVYEHAVRPAIRLHALPLAREDRRMTPRNHPSGPRRQRLGRLPHVHVTRRVPGRTC